MEFIFPNKGDNDKMMHCGEIILDLRTLQHLHHTVNTWHVGQYSITDCYINSLLCCDTAYLCHLSHFSLQDRSQKRNFSLYISQSIRSSLYKNIS